MSGTKKEEFTASEARGDSVVSSVRAPGARGPNASFALRVLLLIALGLSLTAPANATSDADGDDPQLEAPIQQGIALRRAGNDEAALNLFLDLERSNPDSIRVLLHITTAAQATGRWLMAYSYLRKAYLHKNEPYFLRYRSAIKNIEDATTQHVGQLRVAGTPVGAEVRVNGELIGSIPMVEPKPMEVGQYVLDISMPGFYRLHRPVLIGPGSAVTQETIELHPATQGQDAFAGNVKNSGTFTGARHDAPERTAWWRGRWLTWSLAGATVLSASTSAAALIYRNDRAARWNGAGCLDGTRTRQEVCGGVRDDISLADGIAVGTGIAALVFGGATLTQGLLSPEHPPNTTRAAPELRCRPGLATFVCSGSF